MDIPTGILFGIIAMLSWGASDFLVAIAVRKTDVFRTVLWSHAIGIMLYIAIFLAFFELPRISMKTAAIILATSFLSVASYMLFYKSLQAGKVSINAPIGVSWPAVTVILGIIFLHETMSAMQAFAIALVILGGILASFRMQDLAKHDFGSPAAGVKYALVSMLGWGVVFVFIDVLVRELGWFFPALLTKIAAMPYLVAYAGLKKRSISQPKSVALYIILIGIFEVSGFLSYGFGLNSSYTSIVAPIIAASPAATLILAKIFFKETLDANQKAGVVSVVLGLILLSM